MKNHGVFQYVILNTVWELIQSVMKHYRELCNHLIKLRTPDSDWLLHYNIINRIIMKTFICDLRDGTCFVSLQTNEFNKVEKITVQH